MKNIKIIFSDIDDTFVPYKKSIGKSNIEIPEINVEAAKMLQKQNKYFVFISGKSESAMKFTKKVRFNDFGNYVIMNDGSRILNVSNDEVIYENKIDINKKIHLMELCNKLDSTVIIDRIVYFSKKNNAIYNKDFFDFRTKVNQFIIIDDFLDNEFINKLNSFKIEISISDKSNYELFKNQLIESKLYDFHPVDKHNRLYVYNSGTNKAIGAKKLLEYLSIDENNSIFFGDQINDLSIFKEFKNTVSVQNATDEIIKLSKFQTDSCENGGVGKFITNKLLTNEVK